MGCCPLRFFCILEGLLKVSRKKEEGYSTNNTSSGWNSINICKVICSRTVNSELANYQASLVRE